MRFSLLPKRFRKVRGLILAIATAFVVVQFSPYAALANHSPDAIALTSPSTTQFLPETLSPGRSQAFLAQLQNLPNGTASLPDFEITQDTFQFSNSELVSAIDWQRDAAAWEEVLTEQLEQLFGTQVCIGSEVQACVLTSAAKDWLQTQLERIDLGIGEGMAAAVLSLWQQNPPPQIPWWQRLINFLLGQIVFGLARSLFELQTFIANLFLTQSLAEVFQATQEVRDTYTPTDILLTVLDVFLTGSLNPFTMGVYRVLEGVLTEGHSLTPYQIEDKGEGKYWVYVYDSNYPAGRAATPTDLHVEFDTISNTWTYQPAPDIPAFQGNAESKNIDLTQLSWRQIEKVEEPPYKGPFTCPFCGVESTETTTPEVGITLIGEGKLSVSSGGEDIPAAIAAEDQATQVPFRGGLYREVPAGYRFSAEVFNQPLKIALTGTPTPPSTPAILQLTGPGYTADFENLPLLPEETLTLYVVPTLTGPELTFVANQAVEIPNLSIHLTDDSTAYEFASSTPEYFSLTERQVAKSSEFKISNLKLPAGKRVAMAVKTDIKRLYFADDDSTESTYNLAVRNRIVIRDRVQVGERQPDFVNYALTYKEDLRASNIEVAGDAQAYFDYNPTFLDPADKSRDELLTSFEQRDFPITIAYQPFTLNSDESGPLRLVESNTAPIAERVFQGALRKSMNK